MRHGSAPNLPDAYVKAIDGLAIGPDVGSCGTAMYSGKTVIVTDILEDPLWDDYRSLAVANGLRACWSTPVSSHDDQVLGSFAVYHRERHVPDADELRLIDIAVYLARVAIERQRTHDALLMSEARFAKAFKANPQPMSITTLNEGRYVDCKRKFPCYERLCTRRGY
jgi:GAF domain-containing protein